MRAIIISRILNVAGFIVFITGIINAWRVSRFEEYSGLDPEGTITMEWSTFFMVSGSAIMNGIILIGIAEVIRLLDGILKKEPVTQSPSITKPTEQESVVPSQEEIKTGWNLTREDEEKIYELYSDKAILEIRLANLEGYCIVKVQDTSRPLNPEIKVVDVGGFSAKDVQDTEKRNKILEWYYQQ
ncbi:hypothetical protein BN988_01388 [Oceanobacillus picturae]|uniref:Uncharacterized protein n=1 Tax=Oceanobacillus picturae TaxID=171693 RepID=W9ABN5_9BACI|nr:hypothetical protein [Oceanobacillus picturae]CDO02908.1 hypothetical protein BN988_01388 [Oceanobacillus picturae]